jgi:hypothetical protein
MAAVTAPDIAFALCTDPGELRRLAEQWSRCGELWIDTETADWQTPHPRLSLLQVRTPEGSIHVVDVLAPGIREVVDTVFIPAVMANPAVRKWAHSAGFERRYLGGAVGVSGRRTPAVAADGVGEEPPRHPVNAAYGRFGRRRDAPLASRPLSDCSLLM